MSQCSTPSTFSCSETLDQDSEATTGVPGAWETKMEHMSLLPSPKSENDRRLVSELTTEDVRKVNELGRLTPKELHEFITNIQNAAYVVGIDEARQFSKGKLLQVFKQ